MNEFIQERKAFVIPLTGVLIVALILAFLPVFTRGATVTSRSDTLSDSRPSASANHTVSFTTATGDDIAAGETVVIDFGGSSDVFNIAPVVIGDIDFEVAGTDHALVATGGCGAPANELEVASSTAADTITFTRCSGDATIASGTAISVKVGTNADGGTNQIANPSSAGVYDITVAGTFQASAVTSTIKVAVISGVSVTATISETLTFTVAGMAAGSCTTPSGGTDVTSTSSSIDYSTINVETFYDGCQDLTVTTNASGGYATTVKMLDELQSGSTEIARGNCDGSCTATTSAAWATATNNGFAYCMDDQTGTSSIAAGWAAVDQCDDGTPLFRIHPINPGDSQTDSPVNVMQNTGPTNHTSRIAHRLNVDTIQLAGAYTGTIVYVTSPTY